MSLLLYQLDLAAVAAGGVGVVGVGGGEALQFLEQLRARAVTIITHHHTMLSILPQLLTTTTITSSASSSSSAFFFTVALLALVLDDIITYALWLRFPSE